MGQRLCTNQLHLRRSDLNMMKTKTMSGSSLAFWVSLFAVVMIRLPPSAAFSLGRTASRPGLLQRSFRFRGALLLEQTSGGGEETQALDIDVASQFSVKVCVSSSCTTRLAAQGVDQYAILGEVYERAKQSKVDGCMVIEDGTCNGGKNCKLGPCVSVYHDDFDGSVALEGMKNAEFEQRVFHSINSSSDVDRVWDCVTNAVTLMSDEESA